MASAWLSFIQLCDDSQVMQASYDKFVGSKAGQLKPESFEAVGVECILDAASGKCTQALRKHAELVDTFMSERKAYNTEVFWIHHSITEAAIMRHGSKMKDAKQCLIKADDKIEQLPAQFTLSPYLRGLHYLNALKLASGGKTSKHVDDIATRGRKFFEDYIDRGFVCFRKILEISTLQNFAP